MIRTGSPAGEGSLKALAERRTARLPIVIISGSPPDQRETAANHGEAPPGARPPFTSKGAQL